MNLSIMVWNNDYGLNQYLHVVQVNKVKAGSSQVV